LGEVTGEPGLHAETMTAVFELKHDSIAAGFAPRIHAIETTFQPRRPVISRHERDEA
jgi:hypothetical protein